MLARATFDAPRDIVDLGCGTATVTCFCAGLAGCTGHRMTVGDEVVYT
jgi:precorrin-6B methylase 2